MIELCSPCVVKWIYGVIVVELWLGRVNLMAENLGKERGVVCEKGVDELGVDLAHFLHMFACMLDVNACKCYVMIL